MKTKLGSRMLSMALAAIMTLSVGFAVIKPVTVQAAEGHTIIPKPVSYTAGTGSFTIYSDDKINVFANDAADLAEANAVGEYLAGKLRTATGYALPVANIPQIPTSMDGIYLYTIPTTQELATGVDYATAGDEGYRLNVSRGAVVLTAYTTEGLFRGIQTIRQMLPAEIEKTSVVTGVAWTIPGAAVVDYARYEIRSIALDVARKYFTKEEVMRQIDLFAQYKLNTVHIHMSDDQGFRIAFDGYPELSQFGGQTKLTYASAYNTGGIVPAGGNNTGSALNRLAPGSISYGVTPNIYSKADFQEIIDFAEARFVQIIPEIEIPTHAHSQQLSLPLLNGTISPLGQMPNAGIVGTRAFWTETVGQSVPADPTGTDKYAKYTTAFITDIYTQLAKMLPERSDIIHLGGDEPNNTAMTKTIYNNVQKLAFEVVHNAGKRTMQWNADGARGQDDVSRPTLDIVQNWDTNTTGNGAAGTLNANPNAKVIFSLANQVYIDHRTSTSFPVGGSWANGNMTIPTMFNIDPENAVPPAYRNQGYVIGIDSPCWSETYGTRQALDMLLWPRAMCIAEVGWSPAEVRTGTGVDSVWATSFQPRMAAQGMRMTYEDIFFTNDTSVWPSKSVTIGSSITGTNTWASPGVTTPMNTPVSGQFTFTTAEPDTVAIKKCSEPSQGTVTLDADGNWTYTPNAGFMGKDSFTVGFQVVGYGMPLGPAASSNRGTTVYNGLRNVYINVTGTGTHAVKVTKLATSPTNIRVKLDPPVPSLNNTNFTVSNTTVRMAETFDNGSTYFLVTEPRHDGNKDYTLTITRTGTDPAYTFNSLELPVHTIIPKPVSYIGDSASFIIKDTTKLYVDVNDSADLDAAKDVAEYLAGKMRPSTGFGLEVLTSGTAGIRDITLKTIAKTEDLATDVTYAVAGDEGYAISITVDGAVITAYTTNGLFNGIQTIRQMLPAEIEKSTLATGVDWVMSYATIVDYPRYGFRAIHLDSARHFWSKEEIMRQIDLVSQYKMNVIHMHLTDNQGFRIAFDGYEELTEFGGATKNMGSFSRAVPGSTNRAYPGSLNDGKAGYYTQDDYKEIVAYAKARYVDIIPEIEFPGHSVAELFSLPLLNGTPTGGFLTPYMDGLQNNGSNSNRFINDPAKNPYTAEVIDSIIKQLAELSPSKYIHMGGDEVYNMTPADYTDATQYVVDAIKKEGKLSIQWVQDNANVNKYPVPDVIQNWKYSYDGLEYIKNAVEGGAKVIANLSDHTYFDHPVDRMMPIGATWTKGATPGTTKFLSTSWCYQWDPEQATMIRTGTGANATFAPSGYEDRIIGVECCHWSEGIGSQTALDISIYPRLQGFAEIGWSPKEDRAVYTETRATTKQADLTKPSWINHRERLAAQGPRMTYQGIDFMNDPDVWPTKEIELPTKSFDVTTAINTPVSGKIDFAAKDAADKAVIKVASNPSQGTVTLNADGSWTYVPTAGFIGVDSFVTSLSTEGYGIAFGKVSSGNANGSTNDFKGFAKVFITVTGDSAAVYDVTVKSEYVSANNIKITLNPPVPGMRSTLADAGNFLVEGARVRYAETYDNGSTYVLITEPRDPNKDYTLAITKAGYNFNSVSVEINKQYTITFDMGDAGEDFTRAAAANWLVIDPEIVVPSYTFEGWFKDAEFTMPWDFSSDVPTKDLTLFGKFVPIPVSDVKINGGSLQLLKKGKTLQLSATVTPDDALNKKVTWTSSNPAVVAINVDTGLVTGVATGMAMVTVTAEDGGLTYNIVVRVTA